MTSYGSRLGKFNQAMVLTQYLINNGIDNLWVADGNSDEPSITKFSIKDDSVGSMEDVTLVSPRLILQPESDPMSVSGSETLVFQMRIDSGILKVKRDSPNGDIYTDYDMGGWKFAYKAMLLPAGISSTSPQAKQLIQKMPSTSSNYSITQLKLLIISSEDRIGLPLVLSHSSFGSNPDMITSSIQTMVGISTLMIQKLGQLSTRGLLCGGYNALLADPKSLSNRPPTFVPTGMRLQQYPWIGNAPLSQPSYGTQGSARLNTLCFAEMTNNNQMPYGEGSTIPVNGNMTSVVPPALASSTTLPRTNWTIEADSEQPGFEAKKLLDGDENTYWHTMWAPQEKSHSHGFTIDMHTTTLVNGLTYLPRQDLTLNGTIGKYEIDIGLDNSESGWTYKVASGFWSNDKTLKKAHFTPSPARYVRMRINEAAEAGKPWSSGSEINILTCALARDYWQVQTSSSEPGYGASNVSDGVLTSYWHSQYSNDLPKPPHYFTIDRKRQSNDIWETARIQGYTLPPVSGLSYIPRQDGSPNGRIGAFKVEAKTDGITWTTLASGSWPDDASPKTVAFAPTSSQLIRLVALSEAGGRGPWASAAEINLLDGTSISATASSSDFGRFIMSRQNFWERYLLPKLRVINAALESHCQKPSVRFYKNSGFNANSTAEWSIKALGIGNNEQTGSRPQDNPFYDFKEFSLVRQKPPRWVWGSSYPRNENNQSVFTQESDDGWGDHIKLTTQCSTTNNVSIQNGSQRIMISGSTNVNLYLNIWQIILGVRRNLYDEHVDMSVNWTIYLDLVSVSDGGLAINMTKASPSVTINTPGLNKLSDWPDYLRTCFNSALTRFGDLENQLQQDLAGQQKFYFPASGAFFFKDPSFNEFGDLVCKVSYNGNIDDGRPNPDAQTRKDISPDTPRGAPSQPADGKMST